MTIQNQIHLKIRKAFSVRLLGTRVNTCSLGNGERLVFGAAPILELVIGGRAAALEFFLNFFLARTRARQAVFVFSLHLFTRMPQKVVAQCVRGEGFLFLGSRWW